MEKLCFSYESVPLRRPFFLSSMLLLRQFTYLNLHHVIRDRVIPTHKMPGARYKKSIWYYSKGCYSVSF